MGPRAALRQGPRAPAALNRSAYRWAKWVFGAAGLPLAAGAVAAAALSLLQLASRPRETVFFLGGFLAYPLWRLASAVRQGRLYVLGHELAHAMAAWASGYRVHRISVGRRGGHVDLSGSNAAVALAPYVLPTYTLMAVVAYRLWLLRFEAAPWSEATFLSLAGLSLSFHLVATAEILLGRRQSDLAAAGGVLFSLTAIGLCNGVFVVLLLKCLFPGAVSVAAAHRTAFGFAEACLGALEWSVEGVRALWVFFKVK